MIQFWLSRSLRLLAVSASLCFVGACQKHDTGGNDQPKAIMAAAFERFHRRDDIKIRCRK